MYNLTQTALWEGSLANLKGKLSVTVVSALSLKKKIR